jgi:hypothetical protein
MDLPSARACQAAPGHLLPSVAAGSWPRPRPRRRSPDGVNSPSCCSGWDWCPGSCSGRSSLAGWCSGRRCPPRLPRRPRLRSPQRALRHLRHSSSTDHLDTLVRLLAGYGVLMVIAQLRLLRTDRRLSFMPGFWSFTFAWTAVVSAGFVLAWGDRYDGLARRVQRRAGVHRGAHRVHRGPHDLALHRGQLLPASVAGHRIGDCAISFLRPHGRRRRTFLTPAATRQGQPMAGRRDGVAADRHDNRHWNDDLRHDRLARRSAQRPLGTARHHSDHLRQPDVRHAGHGLGPPGCPALSPEPSVGRG